MNYLKREIRVPINGGYETLTLYFSGFRQGLEKGYEWSANYRDRMPLTALQIRELLPKIELLSKSDRVQVFGETSGDILELINQKVINICGNHLPVSGSPLFRFNQREMVLSFDFIGFLGLSVQIILDEPGDPFIKVSFELNREPFCYHHASYSMGWERTGDRSPIPADKEIEDTMKMVAQDLWCACVAIAGEVEEYAKKTRGAW